MKDVIAQELGDAELASAWSTAFSRWPVFVSFANWSRMRQVVQAIEQVVALPAWREQAFRSAPAIARHDPQGAAGVFFGYDFHADGESLGLIEINTNAGGALVNTLLARAQRKCCPSLRVFQPGAADADTFEARMVEMFRSEWRLARGDRPLRSVGIVDESPETQYLYPEFLLFQRLLTRNGIRTVIADPSQLTFHTGALRYEGEPIDLVYNRSTDFYLEAPGCAALRDAYLSHAVVLTPHPQSHALYADKRRLVTLSDDVALQGLGASEHVRSLLRNAIPATMLVAPENEEELWRQRRELFFKPFAGFGSRAAYRGDKVTKRVWEEITKGGYVAQRLVRPGTRVISVAAGAPLKFDLRFYTYLGEVQWTAARLYQGQTTNFRTPGGGFAPVYTLAAELGAIHCGSKPLGSHASFVFLMDGNGKVHPLPHELYVALARGEAVSPALAGQRFRAADWHVRMDGGAPAQVVGERYGWVRFDDTGHFDSIEPRTTGNHAQELVSSSTDPSALPTAEERALMSAALFTGA